MLNEYWSFYPSEAFSFDHFTLIHPVLTNNRLQYSIDQIDYCSMLWLAKLPSMRQRENKWSQLDIQTLNGLYCTKMRFTSFPSSGFIITIVVNRLDRNLVYCICHSLLNISLYDSSAEAKLAPIFVTNTAINVTLMQQVTIHVLWSGSICTMD